MKDKFQKKKVKEPGEEESGGVVGDVFQGLGKIIPGLGGIVKGLEKSDAFKERLSTINKEVERQLKEAPLKKVGQEGVRRTIIPPKTTLQNHRVSSKKEGPPPRKQKEVVVDLFDEGGYIKIITELPGVRKKDIKTEVEGNLLIISTIGISQKYYKKVTLPCSVKGEMDLSYKNGILQIKAEKI